MSRVCLHIILREDKIHIIRGVLNIPDLHIYLGLMVGIWASLGLDFVYLSISYFVFSLFVSNICHFLAFSNQSQGLKKRFNMPLHIIPFPDEGCLVLIYVLIFAEFNIVDDSFSVVLYYAS